MSPLLFGWKKCTKRPTSRIPENLVLFGQTASKGHRPIDLRVFGRKQAPETYAPIDFRVWPEKAAKIHPAELVTLCHRFVTLSFWAEKRALNGKFPEFPKTSFFSVRK